MRVCVAVRARAPAELSEQADKVGGRLLHWANPYPPPSPLASSPLASSLLYQLSYRTQHQDWTVRTLPSRWPARLTSSRHTASAGRVRGTASAGHVRDTSLSPLSPSLSLYHPLSPLPLLSLQVVEVSDTHLRLNATTQQPGFRYEARVRARGAWAVWSEWSPLVVWRSTDGECFPSPHM